MKINANEIRVGMLLEYKNELWQVLKTQHVKPGKGGAFAQIEMKNVSKNTKLNERFRSSETVEKASVEDINFEREKLDLSNDELAEIASKIRAELFLITLPSNQTTTKRRPVKGYF